VKEKVTMTNYNVREMGYDICSVDDFKSKAPAAHLERFMKCCEGFGSFVIWDPNDDYEGFMMCLPSIEEVEKEFQYHMMFLYE
jgi:hypothetical protein